MHKSKIQRLAAVGMVLLVLGSGIASAALTLDEGFEDGDVAEWDVYNGPIGTTTNALVGQYSMVAEDINTDMRRSVASGQYERVSIYVNHDRAQANGNNDVNFNGPGGTIVHFSIYSTGTLEIGGNELGTIAEGETVELTATNIDYDTHTYDYTATYVDNGTVIGSGSTSFGNSESSTTETEMDEVEFNNIDPGTRWDEIEIGTEETPTQTPTATPTPSENLTFDVRNYMNYNQSYPYSVLAYNNSTGETTDVTQSTNLTIESVTLNGTQVLTSPQKGTLETINDSNVNATVNVTASYNGLSQTKEIVVTAPTVENLEILPDAFTRGQAVFGDSTIFALLVAALLSVAASRFANAFAGLATAQITILIGWFGGYVSLGVALLSVFTAIFIGLNLAQNIEYTVRR